MKPEEGEPRHKFFWDDKLEYVEDKGHNLDYSGVGTKEYDDKKMLQEEQEQQGLIEHVKDTAEKVSASEFPSCEDKMDLLTYSPLAYPDFKNIVPLGNLNPSGHTFPTDHIYWYLHHENENKVGDKNGGENKNYDEAESLTIKVPLIAPADGWVTTISSSEHLSSDSVYTDYDFTLTICEEFTVRFGHVSSLSEKLKKVFEETNSIGCEEYETGGNSYKNCWLEIEPLKVSAGEVLGTTGGNPNQNALDIWAHDLRAEPLKLAKPKRWEDHQLQVVCALDYFVKEEKEKLYARLGGYSAFGFETRTIEPLCGTIAQDIMGTAQGVWFVEGTKEGFEFTHPEDPHLALSYDNVNPNINVFSVGNSVPGLESDTYIFEPGKTADEVGDVNIAFSDVKPGKIYCYEPLKPWEPDKKYDSVILFELVDEETLKIGIKDGGKCKKPYSFGDYAMFER